MAVSACVKAFILALLCGNPILKGAFITFLNTVIAQLDAEIAILTVQLLRLNIVNALLNIEIQAIRAILNKVQNDLNLVLNPLQAFGNCPELAKLNETIQNNAVSSKFVAFQKKLYELNRQANLATRIQSLIKQKEKLKNDALSFIDEISNLCP